MRSPPSLLFAFPWVLSPVFVSLPLPAAVFGSSLESCAGHSSQTTGLTHDPHLPRSSGAPGPHLGLPGTQMHHSPDLPSGQRCAQLPASAEGGGSLKGCGEGPGSTSHLGEVFLSAAAGGSFAAGGFPDFVLSSHSGSFSTLALGATELLCPGGDRPWASGSRGFLVPSVRFCRFSASLPIPSLLPKGISRARPFPRLPSIRSVPMGGLFWWEGDAVYSVLFPMSMMAVFVFPVYEKKNESLALRCLLESFISAHLCQLFPSDLRAPLSQLLSAGT